MARRQGLDTRTWTALAAVYVIWGSTYLGMDAAIETFPPFVMLTIRFVLAGAILYLLTMRGAVRPSAREWAAHTAVGTVLLCVGTGAVAWGVTKMDTGTAALIVASVPMWLTLLDRFANGVRLAPMAIVGLVIGFLGVGLLVGPGAEGSAAAGIVLAFSSLAWAAGSLGARRVPAHRPPLQAAAMQMIGGSLACAAVAIASGELLRVEAPTSGSLLALAYLVVFGSLVGYTAYVWLLSNRSVSLTGTYAYVNPVVAVLLGALFLGERLDGVTFVAGLLVVVAVALVVGAKPLARAGERAALPARAR